MAIIRNLMGIGMPGPLGRVLLGDLEDFVGATGTTQATAYEIGYGVTRFTGVDSGTGGVLPAGTIGDEILVINAGSNALSIYPNSGSSINALSANAAFSVATASSTMFKRVRNTLWLAGDSSQEMFLPSGTGAVARTVLEKGREIEVSAQDFMTSAQKADVAARTKLVDVTDAIVAALATLTAGGRLKLPKGTYSVRRGAGGLIADTIVSNNITISGDGPGTIISCLNAAGALPNNAGNEFYTVFQATSRNNITIEDLSIEGYGCLGYFDSCTNVVVRNVRVDGLLANAGGYLFETSLYFYKCDNVKVLGNTFMNCNYAVYLSGDSSTRTENVLVHDNHFENNTAAGSYTATYPAQVYVYFADANVIGNTFKNIYSSEDSPASGIGYAVYEGDGASDRVEVIGNTFHYEQKGSKEARAIFLSKTLQGLIANNNIRIESSASLAYCILAQYSDTATNEVSITGNNIFSNNTTGYAIAAEVSGSNTMTLKIANNIMRGGGNQIYLADNGSSKYSIEGNVAIGSGNATLYFLGTAGAPTKWMQIIGNDFRQSTILAVYMEHAVGTIFIGNTILDADTSAAGYYAVNLGTGSAGSFIANNVVGNTAGGGGAAVGGFLADGVSISVRIFKDIVRGNSFINLATPFAGFPTTTPDIACFDFSKNDFVENASIDTGEAPGWHCVSTSLHALTANASSASTNVDVADTTGYAVGDLVLLIKDNNPYNGDYTDATKWHSDTIASITSGTRFVLTTGIPAGDGTYVSGTAYVKRCLFKADAVIA